MLLVSPSPHIAVAISDCLPFSSAPLRRAGPITLALLCAAHCTLMSNLNQPQLPTSFPLKPNLPQLLQQHLQSKRCLPYPFLTHFSVSCMAQESLRAKQPARSAPFRVQVLNVTQASALCNYRFPVRAQEEFPKDLRQLSAFPNTTIDVITPGTRTSEFSHVMFSNMLIAFWRIRAMTGKLTSKH